jgi:hypothetical protein
VLIFSWNSFFSIINWKIKYNLVQS